MYDSAYGKITEILLSGKEFLEKKTAEHIYALTQQTDAPISIVYILEPDNMLAWIFERYFRAFLKELADANPTYSGTLYIEDILTNTPPEMDIDFWEKVFRYIIGTYPLERCTLLIKQDIPNTSASAAPMVTVNLMEHSEESVVKSFVKKNLISGATRDTKFDPATDYLIGDGSGGVFAPRDIPGLSNPKVGTLLGMIASKNASGVATVSKVSHVEHFVQGGDMIVGDDFIMIGRNTFLTPPSQGARMPIDVGDFINGFKTDFHVQPGVNIIIAGLPDYDKSFWDYYYHLDLYLTYVGKDEGKYQFLVGQITDDMIDMNRKEDGGLPNEAKHCQEKLATILNNLRTQCDVVAPGKFSFKPVPLLHFGGFCFPYNNSVVEIINDNTKNIIVPQYFSDPDAIADGLVMTEAVFSLMLLRSIEYLAAFEAALPAGFTVKKGGDYTEGIMMLGSLHCSVNVLKRASYPADTVHKD